MSIVLLQSMKAHFLNEKAEDLDLREFNQINLHVISLKTRNHIINCETM